MKETFSIQNAPSWPSGEAGEVEPFKVGLLGQSHERQKAVDEILKNINVGASDVKCLIDYNVLSGDGIQGRYLVDTVNSEIFPEQMILQIKPRIDEKTYLLSDKVFEHLNKNGVEAASLIPLVDDKVVGEYGGYAFALASYTKGAHLDASNDFHMEALGRGVCKMQQAMETLPQSIKQGIQENTSGREALIQSGIEYAMDEKSVPFIHQCVPSMDVSRLRSSMGKFQLAKKAYCHGDLIDKNAIIAEDTGDLVILDFDDMNYFPEGIDLGMLAFRAGLNGGNISAEDGLRSLNKIIEGYNSVKDKGGGISINDLMETIEIAITYKAALTLGMVNQNMKSDLSPVQRFIDQGKKYQLGMDKLNEISSLVLSGFCPEGVSNDIDLSL